VNVRSSLAQNIHKFWSISMKYIIHLSESLRSCEFRTIHLLYLRPQIRETGEMRGGNRSCQNTFPEWSNMKNEREALSSEAMELHWDNQRLLSKAHSTSIHSAKLQFVTKWSLMRNYLLCTEGTAVAHFATCCTLWCLYWHLLFVKLRRKNQADLLFVNCRRTSTDILVRVASRK
jgi:hypothetical protein